MASKLNFNDNKIEKKIWRKQNRCKNILKKHEGLEATDEPTKYICVGNGGLICGVQRETLLEIFSPCGNVKDIVMIPDKPYSFVVYEDIKCSEKAIQQINGMKHTLVQESILYLFYVKDVPVTNPIKMILPPGLVMITDAVSEEEETTLLNLISFHSDQNMKHRSVKHFGFEFNYTNNNVDKEKPLDDKIPDICQPLLQRLQSLGYITRISDQLTVNHYLPGQGIPPHIDTHSAFEDEIISLSLGSQVIMDFCHAENPNEHLPVLLPRRSIIVMTGESRYLWKHGITPRKSDIVPVSDGSSHHITLSYREPRTSFTFRCIRRTPCNCAFTKQCDSQQLKTHPTLVITEEEASSLENECVTKVYENIATHFSETRYRPWPLVAKFVESLPTGTIVIDAGCGNGKNMSIQSSCFMVGCDVSTNLLKLCSERQFQVVVGNVLKLPFRDNCADVCICIAVIHHLSTQKRRGSAMKEIIRVLKPNGQALVYAWALEQETAKGKSHYLNQKKIDQKQKTSKENSSPAYDLSCAEDYEIADKNLPVHDNRTHFKEQDVFVPWHIKKNSSNSTVFKRFYHLFKEGEIETLVPENIAVIKKSYYDDGNWCVVIEKLENL